MIGSERVERPGVVAARGQRDRPLSDRRQEGLEAEGRAGAMDEAEALQARHGEQRAADRARLRLAQPRLDVAAQEFGPQVGPEPQRLRLAAERGGAEARAMRQALDRVGDGGDQRVAHVLARQEARERDPVRDEGRQILGRVDGGVDLAREQRDVDLLGEQALAAGLGERPVLDRVAARADDPQLDVLLRPAVRLREPAPGLVGLSERQRRAAGAKDEKRRSGHGNSLRARHRRLYSGNPRRCQTRSGRVSAASSRRVDLPSVALLLSPITPKEVKLKKLQRERSRTKR